MIRANETMWWEDSLKKAVHYRSLAIATRRLGYFEEGQREFLNFILKNDYWFRLKIREAALSIKV